MSTLIRVAPRANTPIPATLLPGVSTPGQSMPQGVSFDPLMNVSAALPKTEQVQDVQQLASASASERTITPDEKYKWIAVGLIVGGCVFGMATNSWFKPKPFAFEPGIGVFALFYVIAQAIERILELLQFVAPGAGATVRPDGNKIEKDVAKKNLSQCLKHAINHSTEPNLKAAAEAKADVEIVQMNRSLLAWSLGSFLAMVGSGALGLYLIDTIAASVAPPRWIDLIITGIVIGAGTKPLHDLTANIEAAKQNQEIPAEARG